MPHTARCACGACSFSLAGTPVTHSVCHCTNCKQRTGSAFGISCYFKRTQVVAQVGATQVYAFHHTAQGHDQTRHFCPRCGTTLFWHLSSLPALVGVAAGCFGEQAPGEPDRSFTHGKKYAWVGLPERWRTIDA